MARLFYYGCIVLLALGCDDADEADPPDAAPTPDAGARPTGECGPDPAWNALFDDVTQATRVVALDDGGFVVLGETVVDQRQVSIVARYAPDGEVMWKRDYASWRVEAELGAFETGPRDGRFEAMMVHRGELVLAGSRARFSEPVPGWVVWVDLEDGAPDRMAPTDTEAWEIWPRGDEGVILAGLRGGAIGVQTLDEDGIEPIDGPNFEVPLDTGEMLVDFAVTPGRVVVLTTALDPERDTQSARLRAFDAAGNVAWERFVGTGLCSTAGVALEPHFAGGVVVLAASSAVQGQPGANVLSRFDAEGALVWTRKIAHPTVPFRHAFTAVGEGFLMAGEQAELTGAFRWVGLRDGDGLELFGRIFTNIQNRPAVAVTATADLRLVLVGQVEVLVTEPFSGCRQPVDDLGDIECGELTGMHATGELPGRLTLWWSCLDPVPELLVGSDDVNGTVCVDGAPAHPPLPAGLVAVSAPARLHPLQSFGAAVDVGIADPDGSTEARVFLHDPLDGSGWQRREVVQVDAPGIHHAMVERSGVFVLAREAME